MTKQSLYVAELVFNLNRFVDERIRSRPTTILDRIPDQCFIGQTITGDYQAITGIYAEKDVLTTFAVKYSKIELEKYDSIVPELAADFMNLHNGLFLVNLSDSEHVESSLLPPMMDPDKNISAPDHDPQTVYQMPVEFDFGVVNFILAE